MVGVSEDTPVVAKLRSQCQFLAPFSHEERRGEGLGMRGSFRTLASAVTSITMACYKVGLKGFRLPFFDQDSTRPGVELPSDLCTRPTFFAHALR